MLDFFLSREEQWFRIDGAKVGLDGQTSTVVLANARHVYEQIQSQLENVRLLTACAKAVSKIILSIYGNNLWCQLSNNLSI